MKLQIKILDTTLQRLKSIDKACFGKLFGITTKDTLYIVGLQLDQPESPNLNYSLPAEIDFYGVFEAYDDAYDSQNIVRRCLGVEVTDNPVFLAVQYSQNDVQCNVVCNNQITNAKYTLVNKSEVFGNFVHAKLSGEVQFTCESNDKGVQDEFANLRKSFASGIMSFQIPKLNLLLTTNDGENTVIGITGDPTVNELFQEVNEEGYQKKKKNQLDIFDTFIWKKATRDRNNSDIKSHAPVVILNKKQVELLSIPLKLNSLAIIDKKSRVSKVYDVLLESAMRNLRLYEEALRKYLTKNQSGVLPQTMHFFPQACGHFLTRIVFEELKNDREALHDTLILSKNFPQFRKANQYNFADKNNGPLLNVHEGVKTTNNGGKIALVKGNYEYYHYCQQKMDDNGWGCAYRSLQTLASWFKLQGFTNKEVPTFAEIQKCLVDLGDKPKSFIDSRQWIGSTEVNYVLDSLLGITSKILFVSSGEEMATKGPELLSHFENHGSPVMIGGGVLAHTILGVDYNQQTGTLFFLILDPHYTGGEDLAVIQNKGWCAWKAVNFWDKTAYYNMCLPQVPRDI